MCQQKKSTYLVVGVLLQVSLADASAQLSQKSGAADTLTFVMEQLLARPREEVLGEGPASSV